MSSLRQKATSYDGDVVEHYLAFARSSSMIPNKLNRS